MDKRELCWLETLFEKLVFDVRNTSGVNGAISWMRSFHASIKQRKFNLVDGHGSSGIDFDELCWLDSELEKMIYLAKTKKDKEEVINLIKDRWKEIKKNRYGVEDLDCP